MNITITPAARERMQRFLAGAVDAAGIRFGVTSTGCSGYSYVVDLAQSVGPGDAVVAVDGVQLIVDREQAPLVDGTSIDFRTEGLAKTFVFSNPNATGGCGCGESFTVGPESAR